MGEWGEKGNDCSGEVGRTSDDDGDVKTGRSTQWKWTEKIGRIGKNGESRPSPHSHTFLSKQASHPSMVVPDGLNQNATSRFTIGPDLRYFFILRNSKRFRFNSLV